MEGEGAVNEQQASIYAAVKAAQAEHATCFIIELSYASVGPCLLCGPFLTIQEAFVMDEKIRDDFAELHPSHEPLITTVRPVLPPQLKADMP